MNDTNHCDTPKKGAKPLLNFLVGCDAGAYLVDHKVTFVPKDEA